MSNMKKKTTPHSINDQILGVRDSYRDNPNLKQAGVELQYTTEQVQEFIKCSNNPLYFLKKYFKISTLDGGVVQFKPHPFQEKLIKVMDKERWVIVKCPRQVGKTVSVLAYVTWVVLFTDNQNILIAANKRQVAEDILSKFQLAYENVPIWLQQGVMEWNKGNIKLENGSKIRASSTTSSAARSGSYNCLTGDTLIKCLINDEKTEKTIKELTSLTNDNVYEQIHLETKMRRRMNYFNIENLFLDNKYSKWYENLIEKSKERGLDKKNLEYYTEEHHIIPKCFFKSHNKIDGFLDGNHNDVSNLVLMTAREHFVAHKFLIKTFSGKNKAKMVSALWMMLIDNTNKNRFLTVPSYEYENIRLAHGESVRLRKTGSVMSDETKEKCRVGNLGRFKGIKRGPEFGKKVSEALTGRTKSDEWVDKINRNPEKIEKTAAKHRGMKRSDETRKKQSLAKEGYIPWNKGKTGLSKGQKWFYDPDTKKCILCMPGEQPIGYISGNGRAKKQK